MSARHAKEDQMNHMRQLFLKLGFTASMLLWATIAVTPATAALIQYSFTGTVDKIPNCHQHLIRANSC
jgi:hypothetical protein